MAGRTSLVEQKRIQWAKEREELARLGGSWGLVKQSNTLRNTIRTYPTGTRMSLADTKDKQASSQPFRAAGHYGSTISLKSLATDSSGNGTTSLKCLDYNGGSLINLHDKSEMPHVRRRSPSLPPIYNKEQQQYFCQDQQRNFSIEGLPYHSYKPQKQRDRRTCDLQDLQKEPAHHYGSPGEEREGETSGYASDSMDAPLPTGQKLLPVCKPPGIEMAEKSWPNPYYATPESSLPPSRRLSEGRMGELNRPRWGSIWGQDTVRGDPPPPSWLSRLGHSSQVLVINHDSASSPDSSTTGSTGSDTNKTYLRGQNIPVDADVLQEREARRQKALELQNSIKQQLEEKDRKRREEKERRLKEERLEEDRIKRERDRERERFEEEQKQLREKEVAKLKQAETMREVLEAAERLAREEKKVRRKREQIDTNVSNYVSTNYESKVTSEAQRDDNCASARSEQDSRIYEDKSESKEEEDRRARTDRSEGRREKLDNAEKAEETRSKVKPVQVPISNDVAIVLSGRLDDAEILNKANLQLVNLVVTPRKFEGAPNNLSVGFNALMQNIAGPIVSSHHHSKASSTIVENRLLTPSKYRTALGRDFGTQTDIESDLQDLREKMQESTMKDSSMKESKDTANASRRDIEKGTNGGSGEEVGIKSLSRSKSQPRAPLDSRPRWNANRPGTRYRTQSEKDPHYQRRLRLRRRQVESSDERSRSPSPDRRKLSNMKTKARNVGRRKIKLESYDADLSMDSLNSIVPLRIDKNGRINLEHSKLAQQDKARDSDHLNESDRAQQPESENSNIWCGQEILSKLSTLRNGLLMKQIEWDSERCLVSPAASEIF